MTTGLIGRDTLTGMKIALSPAPATGANETTVE